MDKNEQFIADELAKKGLLLEKISAKENRGKKIPDFRILKSNQLISYCEVKSIERDSSNGLKKDPIYNRLTDDIHKAVKQFNSVNNDLNYPNILAFVNHDNRCGFLDLVAVTTGQFLSEKGKNYSIYLPYSEGRIKDEKTRIHLYLWYDDYLANQIYFNMYDKRHLKYLCDYFCIDQNNIKHILV